MSGFPKSRSAWRARGPTSKLVGGASSARTTRRRRPARVLWPPKPWPPDPRSRRRPSRKHLGDGAAAGRRASATPPDTDRAALRGSAGCGVGVVRLDAGPQPPRPQRYVAHQQDQFPSHLREFCDRENPRGSLYRPPKEDELLINSQAVENRIDRSGLVMVPRPVEPVQQILRLGRATQRLDHQCAAGYGWNSMSCNTAATPPS